MSNTIYRERLKRGEENKWIGTYCTHNHRTPLAASKCKSSFYAVVSPIMRDINKIMASNDGGHSWRKLTETEQSEITKGEENDRDGV